MLDLKLWNLSDQLPGLVLTLAARGKNLRRMEILPLTASLQSTRYGRVLWTDTSVLGFCHGLPDAVQRSVRAFFALFADFIVY